MTIKRRLFMSNIFMIVIPVLLSFVITGTVTSAIAEIMGVRGMVFEKNNYNFNRACVQMQNLAEKWSTGSSPEQVIADIDAFHSQFAESNVSLMVYLDQEPLYSDQNITDSPILKMAMSGTGNHSYTMDSTAVYTGNVGKYTVFLINTAHMPRELLATDNREYIIRVAVFLLFLTCGIVLLTNRLLTHIVFKSIIIPLDILVFGVHQIRDGNLDYRIEYCGKDEFSGVCADFNEMAQRLLDMVNARQKDDESRRELIAGISHDLRTPLTSIKAYVEGLQKGVAANPQMEKMYLDTISSKADDLEHIVSQLFLFSKLDIGEFPFNLKKVDIGDELSGYVSGVSDEYERKGMKIDITENTKSSMVRVDTIQLANIFTNILENSLKYGNKRKDANQPHVRIACRTENDRVIVAFSDNGPGVPEDALDKLFHVFYRGDKARTAPSKGSGLGLAISAKIIERFGGSIRAANLPEGGLCVTVALPIMTGEYDSEKDTDY